MLILAIVILSPFYYAVLAGDQIRSNVFLVGSGSQTSTISSQVDLPVTLYVGNDLTGVTNPIKRSFFRVSGVYSGGGSVQLLKLLLYQVLVIQRILILFIMMIPV